MRRLFQPSLFRVRLAMAGLVVAGLEAWQISRPSFWADEVATIAASHRSIGQLLHMLTTIDAVHGTYYLLIHFLAKVFGYGPFALRLPSALAVAGAAVIMAVIAKLQFGERLAWFTLVITATLPRLVWAATEARSYGITALLTAGMLLVFLHLLASEGKRARWLWIGYTFVVILDAHFFVYSLLVAGVQGLWLLVRNKRLFRLWLISIGITVAVSAYLITWVLMEKGQVGWLPKLGPTTLEEIFVGQAFWGNPTLAYIANGLILAVIAGAIHHTRSQTSGQREFVLLLSAIVAIPPAIILAYSLIDSPIYDSRYFTMTAPMVALLLALAAEWLFSRRLALVALALIVALAVPSYFKFRATDAKGTHWAQVAAAIHRVEKPGDGILFTDFNLKSPSQSRIMIAYPTLVRDLTDLTVVRSYEKSPGLYPKRLPAAKVASRLAAHPRILVLQESSQLKEFLQVQSILKQNGFGLTTRVRVAHTWIAVFSTYSG